MKRFFIWLWHTVQGIFIGSGAMLPGISGGVLCMIFGIYRPMMEFLSHPKKTFGKNFPLLLPVAIGFLAGFWLSSALLASLFGMGLPQVFVTWLFVGLLVGTLPSLFRTAFEKGYSKGSLSAMVGTFFVFLAFFFLLRTPTGTAQMAQTFFAWVFCGALWGVSFIVPGLSSSGLLMFLGLYDSFSQGFKDFDLSILLPWLLGLVLVVVFCTRAVNYLFEHAYSYIYQILLGIMAASIFSIIPYGTLALDSGEMYKVVYDSSTVWFYLLFFALGVGIALFFDVLGKRLEQSNPKE